jgi:phosphatidate cytidylyltransferase
MLVFVAVAVIAGSAVEAGRLGQAGGSHFSLLLGAVILPSAVVAISATLNGVCAVGGTSGFGALIFGSSCALLAAVGLIAFHGRDDLVLLQRHAVLVAGLVMLVGVGGGALVALAAQPKGELLVAWLFVVVCSNDIAAYFCGRRFGGEKLAPAISPNKTLSGSAGGLMAGVTVGVVAGAAIGNDHLGLLGTAGLSLLVVLSAQLGDLMKSAIKRLVGVKDSGSILPGHGGLIDRLDGVFGAAPILFGALIL